MNKETWKFIDGTDNKYQVSSFGRIKNYKRNKIRKLSTNKSGYQFVIIKLNNITKSLSIHRLVAISFITNSENKKEVNHIDGNKKNNNVNNLEWSTRYENQKHAWKNNLYTHKGENCHTAKLTELDIIKIRLLYKNGISSYRIAKNYNMSAPTIRSIINNKTWKHVK